MQRKSRKRYGRLPPKSGQPSLLASSAGTGMPPRSEAAAPASKELKNTVLSASTLDHPENVG